ncbi:MAG TPA: tRNA (guanosine(37)-N1)-methyltransferase TrmD [Chlamydiales bacterium]|nr:tRNA (guanosine(37)-N1)-methyltransferase TrmD [Chlamydiales bacterium]
MEIEILSLFPSYFQGPFDVSMIGRAREKGLVTIRQIDIRDFAENRRKVDDRPYGGGPGMVLCPDPVAHAIRSVKRRNSRLIYLSPQGSLLTAAKCQELASADHLVILCGHYEGIDERVIEREGLEEISIGDYVLTSGCAAAVVLVDALSRFVPGVIGHPDAVKEDSFQDGIFDAPHYTGPVDFEGLEVPHVLRNGNHAEIAKWRKEKARIKTSRVRPDLLNGVCRE